MHRTKGIPNAFQEQRLLSQVLLLPLQSPPLPLRALFLVEHLLQVGGTIRFRAQPDVPI